MIYINKSVRLIKQMLRHGKVDTALLLHCLNREDPIVVIPYKIPQGTHIIRVRLNNGDKRFDNIKQLTYPPADKCQLSRANLIRQPMFYAALPSDDIPPRITILQETAENLFHPYSDNKTYATFSKWVLKHEIEVFAFPVSRKYKYYTKTFLNTKKFWHIFKKHIRYSQASFAQYIGELMAIDGNESIYTITANTIQYIINHDKLMYKGVVYPSQKMKGLGSNIALTKKTADNCCRLEAAVTSVIEEDDGEPKLQDLEIATWDYYGNITWRPINQ